MGETTEALAALGVEGSRLPQPARAALRRRRAIGVERSAGASHGYERTHARSLQSLAELLAFYMQSPPTFRRDKRKLGGLEGFPRQDTDLVRRAEAGTGDEEAEG